MANNILEAKNVTKRFGGLVAVNDLSFNIPTQSIVSIIGPNGAGKTTLMNILATITRPTEGQVTWNGIDVRNSVWFGFGRTWNVSVRYNF